MPDPNVFKDRVLNSISLNKKTLGKLGKFGKGQVGNGLLGSVKVYEDNRLEDDKIIVGYRGKEVLSAGYFYAPHIPISRAQIEHCVEILRDAGITMIGDCDD